MKKILTVLIAVAAIFTLAADDVLIWKADFTKLNRKNSGTGIWFDAKRGMDCKAEFTKNSLILTIVKNPVKGLMAAQGLVLYTGPFEKGVKYEVSFNIKANKDVRIWASAAMGKAPWKKFAGEYLDLTANEVEDEDIEFTIPASYDGKAFRVLYLGLGTAPEGTVFEISNVKLTKDTGDK